MKIKFIFPLLISIIFISCQINKAITNSTETDTQSEVPDFDDRLLGKWTLEYISPVDGKDVNQLYKIQKPYLNFVDGTKVAGNNGCNNVSGGYSANNNIIKFQTEKFGSTKMFCEGVDEQAFLSMLKGINRFDLIEDGNKLVLLTGDIVSMTFVKQ